MIHLDVDVERTTETLLLIKATKLVLQQSNEVVNRGALPRAADQPALPNFGKAFPYRSTHSSQNNFRT